jgi:Ca2+-binding EF-hand superfamily protein
MDNIPQGLPTRETVIRDATAYVNQYFNGDWTGAFNRYAIHGQINRDGLMDFLREAGIGSPFTRGPVAGAIMQEIDKDSDGWITLQEFESIRQA